MVDSVLMLTTVGSSCLEIWENAEDICCGDGTDRRLASELLCPSFPFTPYEITVPIRIPTVRVAKTVSVYAHPRPFRRTQKALARGSMLLLPLRKIAKSHYTRSSRDGWEECAASDSSLD